MARVIGIGGLLTSGKDTVADYLVEKHGWVKMGMSDPLNQALLTINPYVQVDTHISHPIMRMVLVNPGFYRYDELVERLGYVEAKKIPEVRRLLQVLGTEVGRKMMGEGVWVGIAADNIKALLDQDKNVILTGVRYPNELELIRWLYRRSGYHAELWWVDRPGLAVAASGGHSSETSVQAGDFDRVIPNNGTIEQLYAVVDYILGEHGGA